MSSFARRISKGLYGPNAATVRTKRGVRPDANKSTRTHFYTLHPTKGWRKISFKRVAVNS